MRHTHMMADDQSSTEPSGNKKNGCAFPIFVFVVTSIGISFAVILIYSLLVEQWTVVEVPREFGFDMILYAPMLGFLGGGICTYFAFQNSSQRKIWIISLVMLVSLLGLLSLTGMGGIGLFF
jgi:hypothetical protein